MKLPDSGVGERKFRMVGIAPQALPGKFCPGLFQNPKSQQGTALVLRPVILNLLRRRQYLDRQLQIYRPFQRFGINADHAVNYKCDEKGTALNYEVINEAVCTVRACRPLGAGWKKRIDEDVKKRGK